MVKRIKALLKEEYGIEVPEESKVLDLVVGRTLDGIINYCNIKKIPDALETLAVEMCVEAYIRKKEVKMILDDVESGAVTSIKKGDTQTNFDNGSSAYTALKGHIDSVLTEHKRELNKFRRLG